jgi:hypothetical protein
VILKRRYQLYMIDVYKYITELWTQIKFVWYKYMN